MEIIQSKIDDAIVLKLQGRLDTSAASTFEDSISSGMFAWTSLTPRRGSRLIRFA